jgi:hypothetical protein
MGFVSNNRFCYLLQIIINKFRELELFFKINKYYNFTGALDHLPGTGLKRIRRGLYGILLQALVVLIFVLPQTVNLSMYNIGMLDSKNK